MATALQVDAARLAQAFCKHCFRTVLAVNELVVLPYEGVSLLIRVTTANTLDAAAREVCPAPALLKDLCSEETDTCPSPLSLHFRPDNTRLVCLARSLDCQSCSDEEEAQ